MAIELEASIRSFPIALGASPVTISKDLDEQGTKLWNQATRLKRDHDRQQPSAELCLGTDATHEVFESFVDTKSF